MKLMSCRTAPLFRRLRFRWATFVHEWREEIDRDGKKRRGVMLAGNLAHGLQETQLQRYRLLAHHRGGLHHFFRGLKFALSVDYLSAAFALGLGLLGHGALHRVRPRYILHLDRRDFHAPRFGLPVDNLLQLLVDGFALRQQVIEWGLPEDTAQRGLGDKRSGLKKILHLHDGGLRIDHAEINNGIDRDRHVVTRRSYSLKIRSIRGRMIAARTKIGTAQATNFSSPSSNGMAYPFFGFTFKVNPFTSAISTTSPGSTGVSLNAFQFSPSTKTLPPCESIGVDAVTFFPTMVSAPAFTGNRCARKPF